jgi:hypothetical protein
MNPEKDFNLPRGKEESLLTPGEISTPRGKRRGTS